MSQPGDYAKHWDDTFRSRGWGRYPPEDLVRFIGRNFKQAKPGSVRVLELGCGPGANLWFLQREGYAVSGIDISPEAIKLAAARIETENKYFAGPPPDLRVGNFETLPWEDRAFDAVIDIFALYANPLRVIDRALVEAARVLKPGGLFYSKLWGSNTTGCGKGREIEPGTFDHIPEGPCWNMGLSHFFKLEEAQKLYGKYFSPVAFEVLSRKNMLDGQQLEEFHCQFKKGA